MLVVTVKNQEKVHIGDDIVVTLVRGERGRASLGFEAPADVLIVRDALRQKKDAAQLARLKRFSLYQQDCNARGAVSRCPPEGLCPSCGANVFEFQHTDIVACHACEVVFNVE